MDLSLNEVKEVSLLSRIAIIIYGDRKVNISQNE